MEEQAQNALVALRARLWESAKSQPDELALAAQALFGRAPEADEWADLLDFAALEWVGADGLTEVERTPGLAAGARAFPSETRDALWIVDGWEGDSVLLRDLASEEELAVHAPNAQSDLPRRTVLRARIVPWAGSWRFFGEPSLFGEQGVIARQQLLAAWRDSPEPAAIENMRALRAAFAEQRDQRSAFVEYFGTDEVISPSADAAEERINAFLWHYHFESPLARLGGRTHAEVHSANTGKSAQRVELRLGETLREPGSPAIIFDGVHGVHFLPAFGELRAHLRGEAEFPEVAKLYLDQPELPRFAVLRAGPIDRLAPLAGVSLAKLSSLFANPLARARPSTLPGLSEA